MSGEVFGVCQDGRTALLFTISNSSGMSAKISNFGGAVVNLFIKDKNGVFQDVVMGYDTLAEYEVNPTYFGTIVGRCANRIKNGIFTLDEKEYHLDCNEGSNHLHGGFRGFDKKLWNAEQTAENSIKLTLFSPDGDQKYPGNIVVCIIYTITEENTFEITYRGLSDQRTIFNLTNHTYFNLAGQDADTILDHELRIDADAITEIDENMSVTGELLPVAGTPFDFRSAKLIGQDIRIGHPQITSVKGYDHNYSLNHKDGASAEVFCAASGIRMQVYTNQPGLQLYTGNYLNDSLVIKGSRRAKPYRALCLETQYFPDSINHQDFVSPTIEPGEYTEYKTSYCFGSRGSNNM